MALSNNHYYTHHHVFGAEGDFITAPEISQIFGELLGIWCVSQAQKHDIQRPVIIELGPGRGTLMADMIRVFKRVPDFFPEIILVETSESLQKKQREALNNTPYPIQWAKNIDSLPQKSCFVIANEFLDALPVEIYAEHQEVMVSYKEGRGFFLTPSLEDKVIREKSTDAEEVVQKIAKHIAHYAGGALFIDYGDVTAPKDRTGLTVQCLKKHKHVGVLDHLGEADLTFHIDFEKLNGITIQEGLKTTITSQGDFLRSYGFNTRLDVLLASCKTKGQQEDVQTRAHRLIAPQQMGELFKVLELFAQN